MPTSAPDLWLLLTAGLGLLAAAVLPRGPRLRRATREPQATPPGIPSR